MDSLGTKLARLRGNRSDKQVADEMQQSGLGQKYTSETLRKLLNYWENDQRKPDCDALVMLADFYNVTTDYLLGRQEIEYNYDSVEAIADVLSLDRDAAGNLLKLSVTDGGIISYAVFTNIIKSESFNTAMSGIKKSWNGIMRQIHYLEKDVPVSFVDQCVDMSDMYLMKAHRAIDPVLKDAIGYNDFMKEVSTNGNSGSGNN